MHITVSEKCWYNRIAAVLLHFFRDTKINTLHYLTTTKTVAVHCNENDTIKTSSFERFKCNMTCMFLFLYAYESKLSILFIFLEWPNHYKKITHNIGVSLNPELQSCVNNPALVSCVTILTLQFCITLPRYNPALQSNDDRFLNYVWIYGVAWRHDCERWFAVSRVMKGSGHMVFSFIFFMHTSSKYFVILVCM